VIFAVTAVAVQTHVTATSAYQTLTSIRTDSVSAMTTGVDIAAQNTKDSVIIAASVASAHPTKTARAASPMLIVMTTVLVSATPTGVMKTVASTPDSAIQNVRADVSDQPTQTARSVSVIPTEMKTISVYVTQTGLDQTAANTWDIVMMHVTDVMDHQSIQSTLRMLEFVNNVLITHIVMKMETVSVIATGAQLLTVISTVDHAGRTAPNQLETVTHVDAMAQLSTTVMLVSSIHTAQLTDTVHVMRTGEIQPLVHATAIPEYVTTDVLHVTDQLMQTVKLALLTLLEHHVHVMKDGVENSANTTTPNVIHIVMDVQAQPLGIVSVAYQMPNVIVTEIVSVNQASGL